MVDDIQARPVRYIDLTMPAVGSRLNNSVVGSTIAWIRHASIGSHIFASWPHTSVVCTPEQRATHFEQPKNLLIDGIGSLLDFVSR
jgi:hypothetical protein